MLQLENIAWVTRIKMFMQNELYGNELRAAARPIDRWLYHLVPKVRPGVLGPGQQQRGLRQCPYHYGIMHRQCPMRTAGEPERPTFLELMDWEDRAMSHGEHLALVEKVIRWHAFAFTVYNPPSGSSQLVPIVSQADRDALQALVQQQQ
jgi:hypothetical protein